jgi:hypothetical protein
MKLPIETQQLVFEVVVAVTALILFADYLLWRHVGNYATISAGCQWAFEQWPLTLVVFVYFLGLLTGHLLPTK